MTYRHWLALSGRKDGRDSYAEYCKGEPLWAMMNPAMRAQYIDSTYKYRFVKGA